MKKAWLAVFIVAAGIAILSTLALSPWGTFQFMTFECKNAKWASDGTVSRLARTKMGVGICLEHVSCESVLGANCSKVARQTPHKQYVVAVLSATSRDLRQPIARRIEAFYILWRQTGERQWLYRLAGILPDPAGADGDLGRVACRYLTEMADKTVSPDPDTTNRIAQIKQRVDRYLEENYRAREGQSGPTSPAPQQR